MEFHSNCTVYYVSHTLAYHEAIWDQLKEAKVTAKLLVVVPSAPHDWLLPRCCAAVHHCGAGTAAAVLRAGIPSIPCPVMLDQPWNALRLVEAGVAVEAIPFHKMTAKVLIEAITSACNNSTMQQRAQEVADSMRKGYTGVKAAADIALGAKEPWTKMGQGRMK